MNLITRTQFSNFLKLHYQQSFQISFREKFQKRQENQQQAEYKKEIEMLASKVLKYQLNQNHKQPTFTMMDFRQRVVDGLHKIKKGFKYKFATGVEQNEATMIQQKQIMNAMFDEELLNPKEISGDKKKEIAMVSQTQVQDINLLISNYEQMQNLHEWVKKLKERGEPLPENQEELLYRVKKDKPVKKVERNFPEIYFQSLSLNLNIVDHKPQKGPESGDQSGVIKRLYEKSNLYQYCQEIKQKMNFFEFPQTIQQIKSLTLKLNGSIDSSTLKIQYTNQLKLEDIRNKAIKHFQQNFFHLRLFTVEGVEIFKEDIEFLKNEIILYVSDGQEFDQISSFSIYQILKQLGEGGFGKVLLGKHKLTSEMVAIKIIDTIKIGNATDIDMVFREAELMKSLTHKNIVKIFNCYTLPNMQVVIVMEYLQGGELLDYLEERGRLSEDEARYFMRQIVEAIYYCHNQNLIHRDLKLENILLQSKTERLIKIVDFGIAGMSSNFSVDKIDVGSLSYMAPEVLQGQVKKLGPSIDVWAIGVILFGLIFGYLPFTHNNQMDTIEAIVSGQVNYPSHFNLSKELRDLLSRYKYSPYYQSLLNINPNQRIKMIQILNHPWIQMQSDSNKFTQSAVLLKPFRKSNIGREQTKLASRQGINYFVDNNNFIKSPRREQTMAQTLTIGAGLRSGVTNMKVSFQQRQQGILVIYILNIIDISINPFIQVLSYDKQQQPSVISISNQNQIETEQLEKFDLKSLMTKDYSQVISKYRSQHRRYKFNLKQVDKIFNDDLKRAQLQNKDNQKKQNDKQSQEEEFFIQNKYKSNSLQAKGRLLQSFLQSTKEDNKIGFEYSPKQGRQGQATHSCKRNQANLNKLRFMLSQVKQPKDDQQQYESPKEQVTSKWKEKLESLTPSLYYNLQQNFMVRKKNEETIYYQTFRQFLSQQNRKPIF